MIKWGNLKQLGTSWAQEDAEQSQNGFGESFGRSHHYLLFFGILKVNQDKSKTDVIINLGPDLGPDRAITLPRVLFEINTFY